MNDDKFELPQLRDNAGHALEKRFQDTVGQEYARLHGELPDRHEDLLTLYRGTQNNEFEAHIKLAEDPDQAIHDFFVGGLNLEKTSAPGA